MSIPTKFNPMGAVYAPTKKYTPLQYLQSSGTQSIKTGLSLSKGTYSAQLDMQCTAAGGAFGMPAGAQTTMKACAVLVTQDGFKFWMDSNTTISLDPFARRTYDDEINKGTKKHTFGADGVSGWSSMGTAAAVGVYYLFGNQARNGASMRIYSAKIYQAGVLVRDYVPMLDPDGVPCMFDRVEGVPYYNAGTGDFTYAVI